MIDLTPELLADLRKRAEAMDGCGVRPANYPLSSADWQFQIMAQPHIMLALLDRITTLERLLVDRQHADPP